ncbi:bacteriocin-protection protein, YdeI/OmpD-associated family [Arachidicoccus ginsenosidimutans]|uniref:YdeI/OmpD-associated family protein n=1 Tax=Arachidicoccus sp. BS20 TaxID=1850526 RepID=UPI0007F0B927|nr:YdeI/OmpD-associated family protein [Arachidicoccus sp. BS20]ANI90156.1 bacteriocin-protection protein, YdeI/OmpD-associated family [Arachidicoccus sp. BS20]
MKPPDKKELPILSFATQKHFADWLAKNFDKENGLWLRFFKKDSGEKTITYAQALDEALCYGWIDGQLKKFDEKSYIQKFTPRRAKSVWSKRNIEHIERLTSLGKMKPSGVAMVEKAKDDGTWETAYDSPSKMAVPEDFLTALAKNKKAEAFFETLNKANKYAVAWRLQTAKKPETRTKRMAAILEMLAKEQKFH